MAEIVSPAAPAAQSHKPAKRLALRLDNGTLIRASDNQTVVLKPKDAWEAGLLNESHLLRMQALLCELHAKLPDEGPLKSISLGSKRSIDSVLEVNQAVSNKKSHSVGEPQGMMAPTTAPTFGGDSGAADWVESCKNLLAFLVSPKVLDSDAAAVFRNPPNLQFVPLYPQYISEPMWFDKIFEKLDTGAYAGPEGFYKDVLLVCDNCYKFNVEAFPSDYGTLGVRMENTFLAAWAKTKMAATVPPRPLRPSPPPLRAQPPKKPSKTNGPAASRGAATSRGRGRPGRPPGVGRTKSINSYGGAQYAPPAPVFTAQMQEALVAALHDAAILEANMQGVIDILQEANEMGVDEDGEATLDLEKVTPPTAAKLYDLVVVKTGRAPAPGGAAAPTGGYRQMERDSDDDWDMDDD